MVIKWVWEGLDMLNLKMMLIGVRNNSKLGTQYFAPASTSTDTRCAVMNSVHLHANTRLVDSRNIMK